MKNRCNNSTDKRYQQYGGRGITYDPRWEDFKNFIEDMLDSYREHVNIYGSNNTTLDRINVNDNYYKENCRWITKAEQASNKQNTKYYTIGKEKDKLYTSRDLLDLFCDPTIEYYKLHRRLVETEHYCKDNNIFNFDVFIDKKYRRTLSTPIKIINKKYTCPIKIIDDNTKYKEMRLPKTFDMNPWNNNTQNIRREL